MPVKAHDNPQVLPESPKVVRDIGKWLLFERDGRNLYAVGSISVDRYLMVPEDMLDPTMLVIRYLDGSHDLPWIRKQVFQEQGKTVDVEALCHKLLNSGLIPTAEPLNQQPYSEFLRHSFRLLTFQVGSMFSYIRPLQVLVSPYGVISGAALLLAAAGALPTWLRAASWGGGGAPSVLEYLFLWTGVLIIALIHESFHGLASLRYGLVPKSITFALYLGFIPYVYIKIPGIYTVAPGLRVRIWLAGMYANILIGAMLIVIYPYIAAHHVVADMSMQLAMANAGILVFNLSPFMATDMYFVLSTLSKTPNSRTRSYEQLKKWIRGERRSGGPWVTTYLLLALATVVYCTYRFLAWIYELVLFSHRTHDLAAIVQHSMVLLAIILLLAVRLLWEYIQRRSNEGIEKRKLSL